MRRRVLLIAFSVLAGAGLLSARASLAAGPDLTTPEAAVAAYVDAIARQDFNAVIAATSVDRMTTGFDFVGYVDRLGALVPMVPAPATSPFFQQINRSVATAQIANQVRFLAYGLMTTSEVLQGKTVLMKAAEASDFATVVRTDRLAGLRLVRVGIPKPEIMNSERYQKNAVRLAMVQGAETSTERLALLSFEGLHFTLGFTLLRYGDEWTVMAQTSPIAGTKSMGTPSRVTPEAFQKALEP